MRNLRQRKTNKITDKLFIYNFKVFYMYDYLIISMIDGYQQKKTTIFQNQITLNFSFSRFYSKN